MPEIAYGISAYERDRGDLPELPLVNMFIEESKSDQKGIVLQSRPGLDIAETIGGDPIDCLFTADGVFGGDLFTVTGSQVYRDGVTVGSIDVASTVSFAATGDDDDFDDQVVIAAGGVPKFYDGTLSDIAFPDSANVIKVGYIAGFFIALKENSQRWFFSAALDGSEWDGLDFASAENEPDALVDFITINDMIVFIGKSTIEFWQKTNDADLPFAPITGRVFRKGGLQTGCASYFDNTAAWVSENNIVYLFDGNLVPKRISDNGIEERIADSSTAEAYSFFWEGHEFLCINIDQGTWVYDAATRQWCEFQSYGKGNWLPQCESGGFFGSRESGNILLFNDNHTDLGGILERRFRAGFPLDGGAVSVNKLRVRVNAGQTPNLSGDYVNPVAELRTSRDAGQTFGSWKSTSLGAQGEYRTRVEWRVLGTFDDPGFLCEVRCSDPIPFRISGVSINEPSGGRSR